MEKVLYPKKIVSAFDIAVSLLTGMGFGWLWYAADLPLIFLKNGGGSWFWILLFSFSCIHYCLSNILKTEEISGMSNCEIFVSAFVGCFLTLGLFGFALVCGRQSFASLLILLAFLVILSGLNGLLLWMKKKLFSQLLNRKDAICVYGKEADLKDLLKNREIGKFHLVKFIPEDRIALELMAYEESGTFGIQYVIAYQTTEKTVEDLMRFCLRSDTSLLSTCRIGQMCAAKQSVVLAEDLSLVYYRPHMLDAAHTGYFWMKRIMDIVISLGGLLFLSPVLGITALLIKRDGGPVFYSQNRLTQDGRVFKIYKFRSMILHAETQGAQLAIKDDARITPVGKFIRAFRIDELPQLYNILIGDMSFIGPRPERPEIAQSYLKEIPDFDLRLKVKAGLTGYAQVYGNYTTPPHRKLMLDLQYIENLSLGLDVRILLNTLRVILMPEKAEGLEETQMKVFQFNENELES